MKNLFQPECFEDLKQRIGRVTSDSPRQWGKMNAAQALAHCSTAFEWAVGDTNPPRMLIGRILGGFVISMIVRDDEPMRRNAPTAPSLVISDERDLAKERERLRAFLDRFASGGAAGCSKHPHPFFGKLTPDEWAILMYKHVDHHLRQFSS